MHRIEQARQAKFFGFPEPVTFKEPAARYLMENAHKRTIRRDADALKRVIPYIGDLPLSKVHLGTIQPFSDARRRKLNVSNAPIAAVRIGALTVKEPLINSVNG